MIDPAAGSVVASSGASCSSWIRRQSPRARPRASRCRGSSGRGRARPPSAGARGLKMRSSRATDTSGSMNSGSYIASIRMTKPFRLNRWNRFFVLTMPTMLLGSRSHTGMRVWALSRAVARISSSDARTATATRPCRAAPSRRARAWSTARRHVLHVAGLVLGDDAGLFRLLDQHLQLVDRVHHRVRRGGGSRSMRTTPLPDPFMSLMNGRNTRPNASTGPATNSATCSARWSAIAAGASSPSTTWR